MNKDEIDALLKDIKHSKRYKYFLKNLFLNKDESFEDLIVKYPDLINNVSSGMLKKYKYVLIKNIDSIIKSCRFANIKITKILEIGRYLIKNYKNEFIKMPIIEELHDSHMDIFMGDEIINNSPTAFSRMFLLENMKYFNISDRNGKKFIDLNIDNQDTLNFLKPCQRKKIYEYCLSRSYKMTLSQNNIDKYWEEMPKEFLFKNFQVSAKCLKKLYDNINDSSYLVLLFMKSQRVDERFIKKYVKNEHLTYALCYSEYISEDYLMSYLGNKYVDWNYINIHCNIVKRKKYISYLREHNRLSELPHNKSSYKYMMETINHVCTLSYLLME